MPTSLSVRLTGRGSERCMKKTVYVCVRERESGRTSAILGIAVLS